MGEADGRVYERAGVDLRAADRTMDLITREVESTYTAGVLRGLGAFGGLFALPQGYREPVLVASTDGVGTKVMLAARRAAELSRGAGSSGELTRPARAVLARIGSDLVNHCVNDILVQGAAPLFFLDYVASAKLVPEVTAAVVSGVAAACREAGVALLGGETAEMPGVYQAGEFDLAGTIVGIVERDRVVDGSRVEAGDVLLGLPSGGLQTNGFSLARAVLDGALDERLPDGTEVVDALLAPHASFLPVVRPLLADPHGTAIKAMAHITGGGLPGNLPRTLPEGLGARVDRGSWAEPEIFGLLQERGAIAEDELFEVFNMGVGYVLVVAAERAGQIVEGSAGALSRIGVVTDRPGVEIVDRR